MIEQFNVIALPEARDPISLNRLIHSFATTPLPAFVIRQAGEAHEEALENFMQQLPDTVLISKDNEYPLDIIEEPPENIEEEGENLMSDLGLHMDLDEVSDPAHLTTINFHHTRQGMVVGSFFMPGPILLEAAQNREPGIPDHVKELFAVGKVDTDYMLPHCHRAELHGGDAVVFKEGMPLVHDFTSRVYPRLSRAYIGSVMLPSLLYNPYKNNYWTTHRDNNF